MDAAANPTAERPALRAPRASRSIGATRLLRIHRKRGTPMSPSGGGASWAIDVLDTQLVRVRGARGQLEGARFRLASIGEDIVWRSRAADEFHRDMEERVDGVDRLIAVLWEFERSIRSSRARLLRAQHGAG